MNQNFKSKLTLDRKNGLIIPDTKINVRPGPSLLELELLRETERKNRDLLERERERNTSVPNGESYTGQGKDIAIVGESYEQCVIYFKRVKGITTSLGYAGNIQPNSQTPEVGEGALEKGHISLVIAVGDGWVRVRESNYIRGKVTERTIDTKYIRGYLKI